MALVKSYSPEGSNLFCWMICRLIEYTTGFSFVLHLFSYHSSPTVDVCLWTQQRIYNTTKRIPEPQRHWQSHSKWLHRPRPYLVFRRKIAVTAMGISCLQEFSSTSKRHMSYTKRTEKELWLKEINYLNKKQNAAEKVLGDQLHRYVCVRTTTLLLFKFSPRVLETGRTEETPVLLYCNRKYKFKL